MIPSPILDLKSDPLLNLLISNDESYIIAGGESQKLYLIHIPSQEVIRAFTVQLEVKSLFIFI